MKRLLLAFVVGISVFTFNCRTGNGEPARWRPGVDDTLPNKEFPQQNGNINGIKPNNISQAEMDQSIKDFYDYWLPRYVKGARYYNGCYVEMNGTGGGENQITTSEAHGYGMIIFVLMAGYKNNAKSYFDGMYEMYDTHRSIEDDDLMAWGIDAPHETVDPTDGDSATDGDMDIAYALLLADAQWGSNGKINYKAEAKRIIDEGIRKSEVNSTTRRIMLGDWDTDPYTTRSSDWMTGHFEAFKSVSDYDSVWNNLRSKVFDMVTSLTTNYSPTPGLMPDFVKNNTPTPASPDEFECENDGKYYYNACRFPWRMAADYVHYGTPSAKSACDRIVNWLKNKYPDPADIESGFELDGDVISQCEYQDLSFMAPFIAATVCNSANQSYLNSGWHEMIQTHNRDTYFGDTLNLLSMLLISGNWWAPPQP